MSKVSGRQEHLDLYRAILQLQNLDECYRFFQDLCTVSELRALEQRYDVAVLLKKGRIYQEIVKKTGASSATISRVNRALQYGSGGYDALLDRALPEDEDEA